MNDTLTLHPEEGDTLRSFIVPLNGVEVLVHHGVGMSGSGACEQAEYVSNDIFGEHHLVILILALQVEQVSAHGQGPK